MGTQHAALFQHQADQLGQIAFGALLLQRGTADEIALGGLPGHGPAHVGGQRRDLLGHVLAVQVQPGFQTQGVTCAKADGRDAGTDQLAEKVRRLLGRQDDLQTIFAGVAGTTDEPVAFGQALEWRVPGSAWRGPG